MPVVATVAAAPALAASVPPGPGSMGLSIYAANWSPSWDSDNSGLTLSVAMDNTAGPTDVTVTRLEVHSTYHDPAANGGRDQLVSASPAGFTWPVPAGRVLGLDIPVLYKSTTYPSWLLNPPADSQQQDIALTYYNGSTSSVPCVSGVTPDKPNYPWFGKRLTLDSTYVVVSYSTGGQNYAGVVSVGSKCKCRVTGSYCTK